LIIQTFDIVQIFTLDSNHYKFVLNNTFGPYLYPKTLNPKKKNTKCFFGVHSTQNWAYINLCVLAHKFLFNNLYVVMGKKKLAIDLAKIL